MVLLSPVLWPWEGHLLQYNRSLKAKIRRINRYGTEALALNLSLLLLPLSMVTLINQLTGGTFL